MQVLGDPTPVIVVVIIIVIIHVQQQGYHWTSLDRTPIRIFQSKVEDGNLKRLAVDDT